MILSNLWPGIGNVVGRPLHLSESSSLADVLGRAVELGVLECKEYSENQSSHSLRHLAFRLEGDQLHDIATPSAIWEQSGRWISLGEPA